MPGKLKRDLRVIGREGTKRFATPRAQHSTARGGRGQPKARRATALLLLRTTLCSGLCPWCERGTRSYAPRSTRTAHPADRSTGTLLHPSSRTVFDLQCISVTRAHCVCLSLQLQARSATDSGAASSEAVSPRQLSGRSTGTGVAPWGGGQTAGQRGLPKVQSHALLLEPDDEEASREGIIVPRQVRCRSKQQAGCGQATAASGNPGAPPDVAAMIAAGCRLC